MQQFFLEIENLINTITSVNFGVTFRLLIYQEIVLEDISDGS